MFCTQKYFEIVNLHCYAMYDSCMELDIDAIATKVNAIKNRYFQLALFFGDLLVLIFLNKNNRIELVSIKCTQFSDITILTTTLLHRETAVTDALWDMTYPW